MTDFLDVSELAGDDVTREQVERIFHRYAWAASFCRGKDVLEAACGTGQGLGMLAGVAKKVVAGDFSEAMVRRSKAHYGDRLEILRFDAQALPFPDQSFDVVILFEAIYYLSDARKFAAECRRVLRPGGYALIATANKDLFDFNPSPYSNKYYGVCELRDLFQNAGFAAEFFGYYPVDKASPLQRALRPVKAFAARAGLMPKTMAGKKLLKRIVFGKLVSMPAELNPEMFAYDPPMPLPPDRPDGTNKVIYCAAAWKRGGG